LPTAEPGTTVTLIPRQERSPEEAMALFGSPILRGVPERWLLALLYGGEVITPSSDGSRHEGGALIVLAGSISLRDDDDEKVLLQRGDLFHPSLIPQLEEPLLVSTAKWTRALRIPEPIYQSFLRDTGILLSLERLYRTRRWWRPIIGEEPGLDAI